MQTRCSESGGGACHANGCDQCNNGQNLFKREYSYHCEDCEEIFGSACVFCVKVDTRLWRIQYHV